MNGKAWYNLLRVTGVGLGIALMFAGWYFSASYFGIKKEELFWLGMLVAVVVTFVEFAWRKPGLSGNNTFKTIGIVCYIYDVVTNTLGILEAWGITSNYMKDIPSVVMAGAVGFIFAVIAEPMLSWGITGDAQADLFSGVAQTLRGDNTPQGTFDRGNDGHSGGHSEPMQHRPEPTYHSMSGEQNMNGPMGREARQNQGQNGGNHNRPPMPVPPPPSQKGGHGQNGGRRFNG